MSKDTISALISIGIAIIVLLASYFQWWNLTYNGKMITKKWVKILFAVLIIALIFSAILIVIGSKNK